jgi:phospholipid transport system substrate-binding protein
VLGTHWKDATESERSEYFKLFEDMIVRTYALRFENYSGESFKVTGSAEAGKDFLVNSTILQKSGAPKLGLDWRVRGNAGQMKIVDVVVENVSMSITQRDEFNAIIQRGGGKVESLLASMRQKKTI